MRLLFLLPDIQDIPTGGNIFNNNMVEVLKQHVEVEIKVIKADAADCDEPLAGYDLIIVDSLLAGAPGIATLRQTTSNRTKWVLLVHYLAPCDPAKEDHSGIAPAYLKNFHAFVTTSQFSKDCLMNLGIASREIHVAYPGLNAVYRQSHDAPEQDRAMRMLTVSSLLPGKGLLEFIDMLEMLPANAWTWALVGDDTLDLKYADKLKSRMHTTSVARQMHWHGSILPAQMPACYASYDLFVLPSKFETLGMAIREAMASGLPVVAFDVGGISESLAAGGGILIPAYDNVRMVAVLSNLVANINKRKALGKEARAASKTFPSWEASGVQLIRWLQSTVL